MNELLQSGQHPDADQLSAFIEHVLPAHEQEQTLAHLAVCPRCRNVVALSLPPVEETPRPQLVRRRWFSGWNLVGPAAAALAALVLVGVHIRNRSIVRSQEPPAQMAVTHPPPTLDQPAAKPARKQMPPSSPARPTTRRSATGHGANNVAEPQASERATVNGRSAGALIAPAPVMSGVMGGVMGGVSTFHGTLVESNPAWTMLNHHPLPSGLSALSTVTNGRQVVAIDAHNTPFFSEDGGVHWNLVPPQWSGRAVKVELVSLDHKAARQSEASASVRLDQPPAGGPVPSDSLVEVNSSVTGAVTDPTGASIPNAAVVVTNTVTHVARRTQTDLNGHYLVDNLEPGTYTLEADASGFNPRQLPSMAIGPGQQGQADLTLAVGAVAQAVEVQGANQVALAAPRVKQMIAANHVAAPILPRFEITTDTGERWTSANGRLWKRK